MNMITVALLQMAACGNDQEANRAKGEAFCRQASAMGADIALFPEMWNIGYTAYHPEVWQHDYDPLNPAYPDLRDQWQTQAISPEDPFIRRFQALSRELNLAIALTYLERGPGAPRNAMSLIDRHGQIRMTYAKVHTCDFSLEAACAPGDDFYVCTLDTASGPVKIGAMICYDREFPESARILMLKGAELILTPNACDLEVNRISQFRARAYENMVGLAMANYPQPQCNGHSIAFDGIAFDENGQSRDMLLVEAGENEGVFLAQFDIDKIRRWRSRETWGNAYRKPSRYGPLIATDVHPPFVRPDSRR